MQIFYKSSVDFDGYFFCDLDDSFKVILPSKLLISDFLLLIQASLDQIKPVIIFSHTDYISDIDISELKSHHFKLVKDKYVFLNFSIRNSLKKFESPLLFVNSFNDMSFFFEENFFKK